MQLEQLEYDLTVCKAESVAHIDQGAEFFFVCKTDEEISLVCKTEDAPASTLEREDGWKAFRIKGVYQRNARRHPLSCRAHRRPQGPGSLTRIKFTPSPKK